MTRGLTRRDGVQDNLAGRQDMEPVMLQGPGLQSPTPLRAADTSFQKRISQQLQQFSGGLLDEAVDKQQQRDMLEGQMAQIQGKTAEQVAMGGRPWELEGFRLMDAQTLSSSMLAAQRQEVAQGGYTMSASEYRSHLGNRLEGMTAGMDPRTAELVRAQFVSQLPTLVADHMTQNLRWQEEQAFGSLERSIDVISRDPSATEQLIDFARGGEGSPSNGLSDERRQAATVAGVVRAFEDDNPLAFAALSSEGLLGDNLSTTEQNQIRAAQSRFEQRRRSERNDALMIGENEILERVQNGTTPYEVAAEEYAELLADHDIEMTRAEAGALYTQAEQGQTVARATRGALLEEARLRGDRETQANIIMDSLITTESGGREGAFRTNTDGRSFGGLVQMGQARLNDWANANGQQSMTPSQYAALSAPRQRAIANWHFQELIGAAEATGAIGSTINGVTVTLSGLVAVGHLGGEGGMRQFVSSSGAYNPSDQLGTSLTDYLSKHGSGEMQELMSPNARLEWAQRNLNNTRERLAIDTYSQMQPQLAALEDSFISGGITQQQYQQDYAALYDQYDQAVTTGSVDRQIAAVRAANSAEASRAEQAGATAYSLNQEAAAAHVTPLTLAWEEAMNNPALSTQERKAATDKYLTDRKAVMDNFGIEQVDRGDGPEASSIITRMVEAEHASRQHRLDGTIIANAENAGTVGTLPQHLQTRALEEHQARIASQIESVRAENPDANEAALGAAERGASTDFIARNGIVDEGLQQIVNIAASGRAWINRDGEPNPATVAGLHAFVSIMAQNSDLAMQYVPDAEARGRMLAAAFMVQTEFPDREVFSDVDLTDKNDPVANAFHTAVEQVGLAMERPATPEQTASRVMRAVEAMESGNITNTWFGGLGARDPAQALIPNNILRAGLSSRFDTADVNAARGIDNASINTGFNAHVVSFLEEVLPYMPATSQQGAVTMALDYVRDHGAVMGSSYVMPPVGQPGIRAQMFPGQQVDNTAAVNTAVQEWMASPEVQTRFPVIADAAEGWFGMSRRPEFTVHYLNGSYRAMIPGFGSVALPLREIGDLYTSTR